MTTKNPRCPSRRHHQPAVLPNRRSTAPPFCAAAYGIVCAAVDTRSNTQVAIKRIGDIFNNPLDARRTLREIQVRPRQGRAGRTGRAAHLLPPTARGCRH